MTDSPSFPADEHVLLRPLTAKAKQRCGSKHPVRALVGIRRPSAHCCGDGPAMLVQFPNGHIRWVCTPTDAHFQEISHE